MLLFYVFLRFSMHSKESISNIQAERINFDALNQEDLNRLAEIEEMSFESTPWPIKNRLKAGNKLILLRDEKNIIQGCCTYTETIQQNQIIMHITRIAVDRECRGSYLGLKMMRAMVPENKPYQINLECRPYLEGYYKKLGFKTIGLHPENYYRFEHNNEERYLTGVKMVATNHSLKEYKSSSFTPKNKISPQKSIKGHHNELLQFIEIIKNSTSFWYSGFFHSARKEKAFNAIHQQLIYLLQPKKNSIELTESLLMDSIRAIVDNALVIRGHRATITKSAQKILSLINDDANFSWVKSCINPGKHSNFSKISYEDLIEFSTRKKENLRSNTFEEYPYSHFSITK